MKKFYAVIGNPPYQEEVEGNGRANPLYPAFMDESFQVAEKVELITPARFLFNAGQTPKAWNAKMLADSHFKVLRFEPDGSRVFPNTEIKGGVAITFRDSTAVYEPIDTFIPDPELKAIIDKVGAKSSESIASLFVGAVPYKFTNAVRTEHPEWVSLIGDSFDLRTNILDKLKDKLFFSAPVSNEKEYVAIFGLVNKKRDYLWVRRDYIDVPENFDGYKVLIPKASGNGDYGEALAALAVVSGQVGHTQSFVSIGNFATEAEANNLENYLRTKYVRALMGVYKVTQDITSRVWTLVPLQDFTSSSDIDWSKSIPEIDQQLYAKYGLSNEEVAFIETHVKEMK